MNHPSRTPQIKSLSEILIIIGLSVLGLAFFSALGFVVVHLISGLSLDEIQNLALAPEEVDGSRMSLLILQGFTAFGAFVLAPSLLLLLTRNQPNPGPQKIKLNGVILGLVFGLSILMLPVNAWLAAWNQSLHFPSFLKGFHEWALEKESALESLTLFLVDFQSVTETIAGFLVIALLAGISEEFFFRRLLQPRMAILFGNPHVAIWLTAFLFSAIHMQFLGFVPRMVLGAIFGYYYFWTGRIWLSILGHTLNNGITLAGMLLFKKNLSPINVEDPNVIPWYVGAACAGICWSLLTMVKEETDTQANFQSGKTAPESPIQLLEEEPK